MKKSLKKTILAWHTNRQTSESILLNVIVIVNMFHQCIKKLYSIISTYYEVGLYVFLLPTMHN